MKKVALLFTLLCAGALNGMQDIQELINSSNDLDEVINAIKATGLDKINNIKNFTALVHMLEEKFPTYEHYYMTVPTDILFIASKFGIPAAKRYVELGRKLMDVTKYGTINQAIQLINQGADVNFTEEEDLVIFSPLIYAEKYNKADIAKLLRERGAQEPQSKAPIDFSFGM